MKMSRLSFLPCLVAGIGLVTFAAVLTTETGSFRKAMEAWALRDLHDKAELAAEVMESVLPTGDFRRIREFGEERRKEGVRMTVLTPEGGVAYDSHVAAFGSHLDRPEVESSRARGEGHSARMSTTTGEKMLYCARRCGGYTVRLAVPYNGVMAPVRRARIGLVLSGITGGFCILLVFLFTERLMRRNRELARERDERERQLEEMRRAEAFRRDFVSDVTHEIKTPLTGMMGAVDMLDGADNLSDSDRKVLFGMIRKEARRLDALVKDILSLASLERSDETGNIEMSQVDIADIAREVRDRLSPAAREAGMEIKLSAEAPAVVACDARLVEQALSNLVLNAIRHSGSPTVDVTVTPRIGGVVDAVVEDHGIGLAPEDQARVFERFYRVDRARSRESGGTGLGLAIVKHIARLHGGDVILESAPGRGCRFTLTLPEKNDKERN